MKKDYPEVFKSYISKESEEEVKMVEVHAVVKNNEKTCTGSFVNTLGATQVEWNTTHQEATFKMKKESLLDLIILSLPEYNNGLQNVLFSLTDKEDDEMSTDKIYIFNGEAKPAIKKTVTVVEYKEPTF